jgi:hypothetical protein
MFIFHPFIPHVMVIAGAGSWTTSCNRRDQQLGGDKSGLTEFSRLRSHLFPNDFVAFPILSHPGIHPGPTIAGDPRSTHNN